jgi:TolB-like protein
VTNRRSGLHGAIGQSVTVLALVVAMADGVDAQSALELSLGRIGVRPFVNITGLDDDAWFGVGFAESIAVGLSGVTVLEGTGGTDLHSVIRVEEGGESDRAVGQRLGARWLLTGSYQRLQDQLRVTTRLVDTSTGAVVGTLTVDGLIDQFFELQDRLVGELVPMLAEALGWEVSDQPERVSRPGSAGPILEAAPESVVPGGQRPSVRTPRLARRGVDQERPRLAPGTIDGPEPPVAPAVISRDAQRRATVRATRVTEEIQMDGQLDEQVYQTVQAITEFIQQMPNPGAPSTERTEAWILFDAENLYVAGRIWDSAPPSQWVANEMRRDSDQLRQNDAFHVLLDTFYDRRNGVVFYTNALGAIADFAITNESNPNSDWNPVWNAQTARFEGGWTVEMQIPFRSLRYRPGPDQVWGLQLRRNVRRKNEFSYLTPLPISTGFGAIFRVSAAATLVGLEVPEGSKNLEIKPYAIGGVQTNLNATPPTRNAGNANAGIDVKYGITQNLTADFTYNTDFAQVEVDEQQVNLTRFSLFFPEKREFFLEGRGIFDFARGGLFGGFGALRFSGGGSPFGGGNAPTLFYSRKIGLQRGAVVPIVGGGRVTGKIGAFDVGFLNIHTDDEASAGVEMTNFTVARVKRDILRRSSIGALFTNRSVSLVGEGASQAYGADATFSFFENIGVVTYLAKTDTPGREDKNTSYQGRFDYGGDRYGFRAEHLLVEDNFIPEVGFLRRDNFRRTYTTGRFSPRPSSLETIRQFRFEGSFDYIEAADTRVVQTRQSQLGFSAELENSDRIGFNVAENYEFLSRPFSPGSGVTFPVGGYRFRDAEASYSPGAQHRLTGSLNVWFGEYFNGTIRSVSFRRARLSLTNQFSLEPSVSLNWIDTPLGAFRTDLLVARVNYSFTPRMFFSGLTQYNSGSNTLSNNLRLRWEYSPGSELFVVYTEDRETDPLMPDRYTELRNRGFIVKVNRLFRF